MARDYLDINAVYNAVTENRNDRVLFTAPPASYHRDLLVAAEVRHKENKGNSRHPEMVGFLLARLELALNYAENLEDVIRHYQSD